MIGLIITLDLVLTDVPDLVRVSVIIRSDHTSLLIFVKTRQAVANSPILHEVFPKSIVDGDDVHINVRDLPWRVVRLHE